MPTTSVIARFTMRTISPSSLPPSFFAVMLHEHDIAVHRTFHVVRMNVHVGMVPSSGIRKANPFGWVCSRPRNKFIRSGTP